MRHIKSTLPLTLLAIGATLALTFAARAQVAIQDGPSPIEYNSVSTGVATLNPATFTVTANASVLVVFLGTRTQGDSPGSDPGLPTNTISWNGQTLTRAVAQGSTASTWDDNAIYYLLNPPAGTGSITGTLNAGEDQCWWMAYTLNGVNTSVKILTGSVGNSSAETVNNTVASVPAGDWVAVATSASNAGETLGITTSPVGGATGYTTTFGSSGNATQTMGGISNCPGGSVEFISTGSSTGAKMVLVEAILAPTAPAAPTLSVIPPGGVNPPVQVDLSWTEPAGSFVGSFVLMRSHNPTGPFTDYTNVLSSAATNFTDANVISGQTYYYALGAANGGGTNFSATVSATANVGAPFPTVLGVGAWGAGNIALHWPPSFGATSYKVGSSTTSGGETTLATVSGNAYTNSGLTAGTTYYYTVTAVGAGGSSPPSAEVSAVALGTAWHLFDNFGLDTIGAPLNGQNGSVGLGQGWTNLGGGTPITVSNGAPFGSANYSQYAPGSASGIGDYEAGLGIPGNSSVATVFLEFSLPGIQPASSAGAEQSGANLVAMNFDIDNSSPPGALTGQSATGPSAQFNYDNSSGDGYFRVVGGNTFYYVTLGPNSTPYAPIPGDLYYFWFVINAAKGTYQIYLADASETGANPPGGLGPEATLMWGTTSTTGNGSLTTFGFRNVTAGASVGQPVNYIGTGPGSTLGTVAQNEFANIYVDANSLDLVNPVTGAAPTGANVLLQPTSVEVYAGENATFSLVASAGVTGYQWQTNAPGNTPVNINNGPGVSGATSSTLVISNVSAANVLNYSCTIHNPGPPSSYGTSGSATLTIVTPAGAYETAANAAGPVNYYAFNDANNPALSTPAIAYDFVGSDNGVYGANAQNGAEAIYGPNSTNGFPGFLANNVAALVTPNDEPNGVTISSPWNLNTNNVTITAWIYPNTASEANSTAIVLNRGGGTDVEGLIFNTNYAGTLGYEWNGDGNTTGWNTGLQPPANQWSFVTLVVTPTNATISLMNTNGVLWSTFQYSNPVAPFAGATMIGDDPGTPSGALAFDGIIDEVGIYNQALSQAQLQALFLDASGETALDLPVTNIIEWQQTETIYPAMTVQFPAVVGGAVPVTNIWQIWLAGDNTTNTLVDGNSIYGTIIGSATANLTISNLTSATSGGNYNIALISANSYGSYTSPPVTLSITATNPATAITTTLGNFEPSGDDWNTGSYWSDGNPASLSAYSEPESTYYIVPGSLERSPVAVNAVFPGDVLVIQGNGVLLDGNTFGAETTTGELRVKQSGGTAASNYGTGYTVGGTITFPDLQMAGGQIDNGVSSTVILEGEIDVVSNSAFYADSASATAIRSFQINALLTSTGTITYTFLGTASAYPYNDLIISNPNNTFSGQWNIGNGGLLGNAPNCLGTNSITVGPNGILETTYNLVTTNGSLTLNGLMYLYTADTFNTVTINGTELSPGTYSFASLNSAYPTNFPTTWPVQLGSSTGTNTGVGSITVLSGPPPSQPARIGSATFAGGNLTIAGSNGTPNASYHVLTATDLSLPPAGWMVLTNGYFDGSGNFTATIPLTASEPAQFFMLRSP